MRLALVGGGGFRVPQVYRAVVDDLAAGDGVVDELVLVDPATDRLAAVTAVLDRWRTEPGAPAPAVWATTDLADGLRGADLVFSAIRVGGPTGRILDEQVALREGVLGQETVGAGGISYGLRTVPAAHGLADCIAAVAPDAWVVNFTNPAGVVTEVMSRVMGDRVIGICDSPSGLCRRAARAAGVDPARCHPDYVGINHLGWLRGLDVDGVDVLPDLLADPAALASFEEGRLFGADWLRALGSIPNEYLHYYYFARETRAAAASASATRGRIVMDQQAAFYAEARGRPADAAALWEAALQAREATYMAENRQAVGAGDRAAPDIDGSGYTGVALAVMRAIVKDEPAQLILDVHNRDAVPGIATDSVVEVVCVVDAGGARPVPTGPLDAHQRALVQSVMAVEREMITAGLTGSRRAALRAFAGHPLVDSVAVARRLLDAYLESVPGLAAVLHRD
ncbi:MAG: 6-phospho-beta-glucosidase [Jiangellaceae bacterium]